MRVEELVVTAPGKKPTMLLSRRATALAATVASVALLALPTSALALGLSRATARQAAFSEARSFSSYYNNNPNSTNSITYYNASCYLRVSSGEWLCAQLYTHDDGSACTQQVTVRLIGDKTYTKFISGSTLCINPTG